MVKTQSLVLSYLMANNYSPKPKTINKQTGNAETNIILFVLECYLIFLKGGVGKARWERTEKRTSFICACGI